MGGLVDEWVGGGRCLSGLLVAVVVCLMVKWEAEFGGHACVE